MTALRKLAQVTLERRFEARRRAALLAAGALTVFAAASCVSIPATIPLIWNLRHVPPGVVPTLSLAGRAASGCTPLGREDWIGEGFEVVLPRHLEFEPARAARAIETGGVGHPIVHYFSCPPIVIELAVVVADGGATVVLHRSELRGATELLGAFFASDDDRTTLWTVADMLRIDPGNRFVYGAAWQLSESGVLSLRFDPSESDARVMLVYRLGL